MNTLFISSSLLYIALLFACGREKHDSGVLELRILTREIRLPYEKIAHGKSCGDSCPEVVYALINNSNKDFVLYEFKGHTHMAMFEIELNCDTIGVQYGMTLFLTSDDGEFQQAAMDQHDTTFESPKWWERTNRYLEEWTRNSRVLIKSGEKIEFKEKLDFGHYNLHGGIYYFRLGYAQLNSTASISREKLREDIGNASLFVGCLKSDVSKLIVEYP